MEKEPFLWVCHREEVVCFKLLLVFYECACSDDLFKVNRYHVAAGDCKDCPFGGLIPYNNKTTNL